MSYFVHVTHMSGIAKEKFFSTFEEAALYAETAKNDDFNTRVLFFELNSDYCKGI